MASPNHNDQRKQLMPLLMEHRHDLFSYIFALVPNRADAEDLLQDVSTIIWEKFDEFEEGTNFKAWAKRIAFYEVKASRSKYARSKVIFDETVYEAVAATASEMSEEVSDRHQALEHCLSDLGERDREMLMVRYSPGRGVAEAAEQSGRSTQATYKALARLRKALYECVNGRINQDSDLSPSPGGAA